MNRIPTRQFAIGVQTLNRLLLLESQFCDRAEPTYRTSHLRCYVRIETVARSLKCDAGISASSWTFSKGTPVVCSKALLRLYRRAGRPAFAP
jgi:hypothetical protein